MRSSTRVTQLVNLFQFLSRFQPLCLLLALTILFASVPLLSAHGLYASIYYRETVYRFNTL